MVVLRRRFAIISATLALAVAALPLTAAATDTDGDGIADAMEDATSRVVVAVAYSEGTTRLVDVRSSSKGASPDDVIGLRYQSGTIDGWYFPNESREGPSVEFRLRLRELIEFRGPPVPEISGGDIIQKVPLAEILDSVPIRASNRTTQDGDREAVFEIGPPTGNFSMTLHVTERFVLLGGRVVSPMEVKVDFHVRNFPRETSTSVGIEWDLQTTGSEARLDNTTHDERAGWAQDEREINVSNPENHAMFFSWSEHATVDGVVREVVTTPPIATAGTIRAYFVYPNGAAIDHDPKVGARSEAYETIVGRTVPPIPQGNLFLFVAALAAFSAVVIGTVLWRRGRRGGKV